MRGEWTVEVAVLRDEGRAEMVAWEDPEESRSRDGEGMKQLRRLGFFSVCTNYFICVEWKRIRKMSTNMNLVDFNLC